jgi:3-oxoacyl-[acyl-carrier protein] reductase
VDLGLSGKACVVTGASRGIGLATARLLAAEGASVLMVARGEDALRAAAAKLAGDVDALALDVTAAGAAEELLARRPRVDVLVNNAGTSYAKPLAELADDDWERQWAINVMAPLRLTRAVAPQMAERGWGRIVNVCSSSGKRTSLTNAAYTVAKAAELSLTGVFAAEYAARGVAVNAVVPGAVATGLWTDPGGLADQIAALRGSSRDEAVAAQAQKTPLGRLTEPDEVAAVVAMLCSEEARAVAGAHWAVGFSE